ncbi:O-antigen ligase family protein [Arthrobacter globiformis]|nr:O-antigen ligase family protein [Arthrobacter globiformis]
MNATFVFGLAVLLNAPNAISMFLGGNVKVIDAFGNVQTVYAPSVRLLQGLSGIVVLGLAVMMLFIALRGKKTLNGYVWPLLATCVVSLVSNLHSNLEFATLNQWTALAVIAACLFAAPSPGAALGAALFGALYSVATGILTFVNPDAAIEDCTRKCSPAGVILPGINGSENAFGLCAVLAMPFVLLAFKSSARFIFSAFLAYLVLASGSRSAVLGLVALAVLLFLFRLSKKGLSSFVAVAAAGVLVMFGVILPFMTKDPEAFSTRGRVWLTGIEYMSEAPVTGLGASAWANLTQIGAIYRSDAYSLHNLWLDTLFVSGLIGFGLLLSSLIALIASHAQTTCFPQVFLILIVILTVGILERSLSIYSSNWLGWVLPGLLLFRGGGALSRNSQPFRARESYFVAGVRNLPGR